MRRRVIEIAVLLIFCTLTAPAVRSETPSAAGLFHIDLPPHQFAGSVRPDSPFGINTAFDPDTSDLHERLDLMQEAGIKF